MGLMPAPPQPQPNQLAEGPQVGPPEDPWRIAANVFRSDISTFIQTEIVGRTDHEKTYQYLDIRRNHAYLRGMPAAYLGYGPYGFVDYVSGGADNMRPSVDSNRGTAFGSSNDHHFALYQEFVRKFVAVLGVRSPNVKASALENDNQEQDATARTFQEVAEVLRYAWNADEVNRRMPQLFATDGVNFIYTPWVTNRAKYGSTPVPSYSFAEQAVGPETYNCPNCLAEGMAEDLEPGNTCPGCGAEAAIEPPLTQMESVQGPSENYANGAVELQLVSGLMVTTPYYIRDPMLSDCPWLIYEYERERSEIIEAHPEIEDFKWDEYGGPSQTGWSGSDTLGRTVREEISSYSGVEYYARSNRWLYSQLWIRPHMYRLFKNEQFKAWLTENCPDGAKITAANTRPLKIEPAKLDDEWVAVPPEQREFLYVEPYFTSIQNLQDLVNHSGNITAELMERTLTKWLIDLDLLDLEALAKGPALPGEMIPIRPGPGGRISDRLFQFKPGEIDPAVVSINDWFTQKAQNITGMLPALWGGDEGSQTATEAQQKRNQSLQMLWTVWANMAMGWAKGYLNGARQFARFSPDGTVYLPNGDKVPLGERVRGILQGGFKVEPSEAMPMTSGQQRDYVMELANSNSPEVAENIGLWHPSNLEKMQELIGIPGLKLRNVDALHAMRRKIQELLMEQPIEVPNQQMNPETGQMEQKPPIRLPSQQPDPSLWEPTFAVEVIREWYYVNGAKSFEANRMGFENVLLYNAEWFRLGSGMPPEPGAVMQPPPAELTTPGVAGLLGAGAESANGQAAGESAVESMPTPQTVQ